MFEGLKDSIQGAMTAVQEKYDGFAESMAKLNQDLVEIRDLFVSVKDIVSSVFSFIGQETAILLFCTFLFLFILNLIPFLFLGERLRYIIGICFGAFLSIRFEYTAWSLIKYVLIMLSPVLLEYILVWLFKTTGKSLWTGVKKMLGGLWKSVKGLASHLKKKAKKEKEDEK